MRRTTRLHRSMTINFLDISATHAIQPFFYSLPHFRRFEINETVSTISYHMITAVCMRAGILLLQMHTIIPLIYSFSRFYGIRISSMLLPLIAFRIFSFFFSQYFFLRYSDIENAHVFVGLDARVCVLVVLRQAIAS